MRHSAILLGLAVAVASYHLPVANDIVKHDKRALYAGTPGSVVRKTETVARSPSIRHRQVAGNCSPLPTGAGPTPYPDTPEAFASSEVFASAALNSPAPPYYVQTFANLNGKIASPDGYLGVTNLDFYDPTQCANLCNSRQGCAAINIFFERQPTLSPGSNCTNPPSTTFIRCAFYSTVILAQMATDTGESISGFQTAIAGSNGYITRGATGPLPENPAYNGTFVNNATINAPTECGSYIGVKTFTEGNLFDINRCAAACDAETAYNAQYLNGRATCRFFNTYILYKNGAPQAQYCALYTRTWDLSFATNTGYSYNGDVYFIVGSGLFSKTADPGAQTCDAACMSQVPCPASL